MKRVSFVISILVLLVAASAQGQPTHKWITAEPDPANSPASPVQLLDEPRLPAAPEGPAAMIQYDSGTVNGGGTMNPFAYGNRFNSANGAAIPSGAMVTQVQWYLMAVSGSSGWVSFFGPPAGTSAAVITAINGPVTVGFNTRSVGPIAAGSDFLAGALNFNTAGNPSGDHVGLDVGGTTNSQGFHGMLIHSTFTPTGFQALANTNGVFRVFGTDLPVELEQFEIE